jgi:hypothetical protein
MGAKHGRGTNPVLITAMFTPIAGVPTALALRGCLSYVVLVATVMSLAGMTTLGMMCLRADRRVDGLVDTQGRDKPGVPAARRADRPREQLADID